MISRNIQLGKSFVRLKWGLNPKNDGDSTYLYHLSRLYCMRPPKVLWTMDTWAMERICQAADRIIRPETHGPSPT